MDKQTQEEIFEFTAEEDYNRCDFLLFNGLCEKCMDMLEEPTGADEYGYCITPEDCDLHETSNPAPNTELEVDTYMEQQRGKI